MEQPTIMVAGAAATPWAHGLLPTSRSYVVYNYRVVASP